VFRVGLLASRMAAVSLCRRLEHKQRARLDGDAALIVIYAPIRSNCWISQSGEVAERPSAAVLKVVWPLAGPSPLFQLLGHLRGPGRIQQPRYRMSHGDAALPLVSMAT